MAVCKKFALSKPKLAEHQVRTEFTRQSLYVYFANRRARADLWASSYLWHSAQIQLVFRSNGSNLTQTL